jgi:hypothetical protein
VRCESGILSPFGESSALALLVLGSLVFWWQFIWLCLPECHVTSRPTRATDPVGLSPTGLQPCRLPTRRLGRLSLRRPEASLHFFCPRLTPPLLPLSRLCSRRLPLSILTHDPQIPCSAGKATHGAAAERSSLVRKVSPWSPLRRLPRPSDLQYRTPRLRRNTPHGLWSDSRGAPLNCRATPAFCLGTRAVCPYRNDRPMTLCFRSAQHATATSLRPQSHEPSLSHPPLRRIPPAPRGPLAA